MAYVKELNVNNTTYDIKSKTVVDKNSGDLAFWSGTKQEYDLIVSKDANTVYNITDDTNPTQALLESIYPVGSIYIGTMAICPMSALFGTWTLVGTKLVTNVDSTAGVKGTGIALGITNGTITAGLAANSSGTTRLMADSSSYGSSTTTTAPSGSPQTGVFGVTTDPTKSGIEATVTSSSLTVNIWQRSA